MLILRIRMAHVVFGFLMVILAKVQVLYELHLKKADDEVWWYSAWCIFSICLLVGRKLLFPKLEKRITTGRK